MSPEGLNYLKSKASIRKEVDSEECYNAIEADLPIVEKRCRCKATDSRAMGLAVPWYHRVRLLNNSDREQLGAKRRIAVKAKE
ncbi:hypothetical protein B296_00042526 [Ensete ventricosum]|uniref:Uncharacterized protein n=1 Tax=Ensete ventricosum TaxID=4639 RepID=A0A426XAW7_ENSVE|nr:hypothetical protein B296_00042526 [Ensete ventricosum]